MRLARDARRSLGRLMLRDAANRLWLRLSWWFAAVFLSWSAMTLASVLADYPEIAYHAAIMLAFSCLPAILFLPAAGEPFLALMRRIDEHTALEAWLGYGDGEAEALLRKKAEELLRVRSVYRPERLKPSAQLYATIAAAIACFAVAQALSVSRGYGFSLGYADKEAISAALARSEAGERPGRDPGTLIERKETETDDTGSVAPYRGEGVEAPYGLAKPASGIRRPGNEPGAQDGASGDANGDADGGAGTARVPGDRGDANAAGAVSPDESAPGPGGSSGAAASAPGYEGSGESLVASPLLEYRAAFERAFAERTGKESALGSDRSARALESALAGYYASFDMMVAMDGSLGPGLESLKSAWADAFASGDRR